MWWWRSWNNVVSLPYRHFVKTLWMLWKRFLFIGQASLNPFKDSCVCHGWLRGFWQYNPTSVPQSFWWDVRFVPPYSEYSVEPYISIRCRMVYAVKDGTPYIYEAFPICQKGTSQALGSCSGFAIRVSLLLV